MNNNFNNKNSRRLIKRYIEDVDRQIQIIDENYKAINVNNADVKQDIQKVKNNMIIICSELKNKLESFEF